MKNLILTLSLILFILFCFLLYPKTDSPDIVKFLLLSQIILIVYLFILFFTKKISFSFREHKKLFYILIIIGILIRCSVSIGAGEISYLSDDVYRYIFEGEMVSHCYNPYILSPDNMAGSSFADSNIYSKINHPWHVTIYPPLAQYLFAICHIIGGDSIVGFKILSFLFELLSLFLMFQFVKRYSLPDWSFLIYLFSPLVIIEFLFSNHLDIFGLPFLLGALILLKEYRKHLVGIAILLALATLIKFYILFFIPFILTKMKLKEIAQFLSIYLLTIVVFYMPFIASSGSDVLGSLVVYLETWQYNGSLFLLLKQVFSQEVARYICLGIFLSAYVPLLLLKKIKTDLYLQCFLIFAVYVIVAPALFNWYLLWIIPFVVYFRNIAFIVFSGTCMLSYHVLIGYYAEGSWSYMPWLSFISYLPFYLLLVYSIYRFFKTKNAVSV